MSKERRRRIARKTRAIMKPESPVKERKMNIPKPSKNVQTAAIAGASFTAGVAAAYAAFAFAAFRTPKPSKNFRSAKKSTTTS